MLKNLRIGLIKGLIDFNEKIVFERKLKNYYRANANIKTVVDVGANKGQSIDFFLSINPACTIYALEPNPELFALLKKKYAHNSNIRLFNLGVSNQSGEKIFFENIFDYTSTFEELNMDSEYLKKKAKVLGVHEKDIVKKSYPVSTITLAELFEKEGIAQKVDVLKIDTEGHEYYCLQGLFGGAKSHNIGYIQLENHNDDMYQNRISFEQISELLHANGYAECKRIRHGFGDFDEVLFGKK